MKNRNAKKILFLLIFTMAACDSSSKNVELANKLVDKSIASMVSVKGGDFLMGDFGPLIGEKLPFSIQQDDKVLHKVVLSSFMISKYKVTNADYKTYLDVTGTPPPLLIFLLKALRCF